jgi:hypothetical protein
MVKLKLKLKRAIDGPVAMAGFRNRKDQGLYQSLQTYFVSPSNKIYLKSLIHQAVYHWQVGIIRIYHILNTRMEKDSLVLGMKKPIRVEGIIRKGNKLFKVWSGVFAVSNLNKEGLAKYKSVQIRFITEAYKTCIVMSNYHNSGEWNIYYVRFYIPADSTVFPKLIEWSTAGPENAANGKRKETSETNRRKAGATG